MDVAPGSGVKAATSGRAGRMGKTQKSISAAVRSPPMANDTLSVEVPIVYLTQTQTIGHCTPPYLHLSFSAGSAIH
jgi:hypothetical protein